MKEIKIRLNIIFDDESPAITQSDLDLVGSAVESLMFELDEDYVWDDLMADEPAIDVEHVKRLMQHMDDVEIEYNCEG